MCDGVLKIMGSADGVLEVLLTTDTLAKISSSALRKGEIAKTQINIGYLTLICSCISKLGATLGILIS